MSSPDEIYKKRAGATARARQPDLRGEWLERQKRLTSTQDELKQLVPIALGLLEETGWAGGVLVDWSIKRSSGWRKGSIAKYQHVGWVLFATAESKSRVLEASSGPEWGTYLFEHDGSIRGSPDRGQDLLTTRLSNEMKYVSGRGFKDAHDRSMHETRVSLNTTVLSNARRSVKVLEDFIAGDISISWPRQLD